MKWITLLSGNGAAWEAGRSLPVSIAGKLTRDGCDRAKFAAFVLPIFNDALTFGFTFPLNTRPSIMANREWFTLDQKHRRHIEPTLTANLLLTLPFDGRTARETIKNMQIPKLR